MREEDSIHLSAAPVIMVRMGAEQGSEGGVRHLSLTEYVRGDLTSYVEGDF